MRKLFRSPPKQNISHSEEFISSDEMQGHVLAQIQILLIIRDDPTLI